MKIKFLLFVFLFFNLTFICFSMETPHNTEIPKISFFMVNIEENIKELMNEERLKMKKKMIGPHSEGMGRKDKKFGGRPGGGFKR